MSDPIDVAVGKLWEIEQIVAPTSTPFAGLEDLPAAVRAIKHEHDAMLAEREATCAWTDDPEGIWHTDCGEAFEVHAGSPGQNGLRYCCFCGRKLAEGSA